MKIICVLILFGALILPAYTSRADKPEKVLTRSGEPNVVYFADDDQQMNAAIAQAQKTVDYFIKDIVSSEGNGVKRTMKVRFDTDRGAEHIWVGDVKISGQGFEGHLENEPVNIKNYKVGDRVTFSRNQISDWLIVSNGKIRGGFTIKIQRKQMPPDEQRAFDEQTGGAFKE